MLLGEYHLSLDAKGRLSFPSTLRQALHKQYAADDHILVVTKFFENCLVLYPQSAWATLQQQLLDLPNDANTRAFVRHFCASAHACTLDKQGRILLPPKLRQYAGIHTEAYLIAIMHKFELWAPERWEAYEANQTLRFDAYEHLTNLRF